MEWRLGHNALKRNWGSWVYCDLPGPTGNWTLCPKQNKHSDMVHVLHYTNMALAHERLYQLLWCSHGYILWYWSLFSEISRIDIYTIWISGFWKAITHFRYWSWFAFFQIINRDMIQISKYCIEDAFNEKYLEVLKNEKLVSQFK